jgi:hypothetical protein
VYLSKWCLEHGEQNKMKINVNIMLDEDVYTNERITKLRETRNLSKEINKLLRETL